MTTAKLSQAEQGLAWFSKDEVLRTYKNSKQNEIQKFSGEMEKEEEEKVGIRTGRA